AEPMRHLQHRCRLLPRPARPAKLSGWHDAQIDSSLLLHQRAGAAQNESHQLQSPTGDGIRSVWIYLDKQAIALYTAIKGRFGLSDDWASKVLNMFRRK